MLSYFEPTLQKISAWWRQEYEGRPLLRVHVDSPSTKIDLNRFWQSPDVEPDITSFVEEQITIASQQIHLAESYFFKGIYCFMA